MAARVRSAVPTEVYEIEVTLLESGPRIWRRIAVPGDIKLAELHVVVQCVMGWTDSHLHQFVTDGDVRYESKDPDLEPDPAARNEATTTLKNVLRGAGEHLLYQYDFGDGWDHRLEVLRVGPPNEGVSYPTCLAGEQACPPEDCGGIYGYSELLEALADPDHEDHDAMEEWLGDGFDPEAFNLSEVNDALASLGRSAAHRLRVVR